MLGYEYPALATDQKSEKYSQLIEWSPRGNAMDEILELQRQLAAVQMAAAAHNLSERNAIDIVQKLRAAGKIEVLFTLNGKDFLTPKQLQLEIADELLIAGGRISFPELQQILNVDIAHIDHAARVIAAESDRRIQIIGADLISDDYLHDAMADVNRWLDEQEQLTIGQIATKLDLPFTLVQILVSEHMHSTIQGVLKGNQLFAMDHRRKQEASVRGTLSACTVPMSVDALSTQLKLERSDVLEVVTRMVATGELSGRLVGGEYVPFVFTLHQRSELDDFFRRNKYIRFEQLPRQQAVKPVSYIQQTFPDAIGLKTICIDPSLRHAVEAELEASISQFEWYDPADGSLAEIGTDADLKVLIPQLVPQRDVVLLDNIYVVSKRFIKRVRNLLRDDANAFAETLAQRYRQQQRGGDRRADHETRQLMEDILEPRRLAERRRRALLTAFRELDEHHELLQAILDHATSQWEPIYRNIVTSAVGGLLDPSRREEFLQQKFDAIVADYFVFRKTLASVVSALGVGDPLVAVLQDSLAAQAALPMTSLLTEHICWLHNLSYSPSRHNGRIVLTPQQRKELVKELPKPHAVAIIRLWTLAAEGATSASSEFDDALEAACQLITLPIRRPDKRKERAKQSEWKKTTAEEVSTSSELRGVVRAACMIVLQRAFNGPVTVHDAPETVHQLVNSMVQHAEHFSNIAGFDVLAAASAESLERFSEGVTTDERCLELMQQLEAIFGVEA